MYLSWDNGSQKELIQEVPFNHSTKTICIKRYPIQIPTIEIKGGIEKKGCIFSDFKFRSCENCGKQRDYSNSVGAHMLELQLLRLPLKSFQITF